MKLHFQMECDIYVVHFISPRNNNVRSSKMCFWFGGHLVAKLDVQVAVGCMSVIQYIELAAFLSSKVQIQVIDRMKSMKIVPSRKELPLQLRVK